MKYNKTLALIPAILLAACGGEEQTINEPTGPGSVVYSYPADGQIGVSQQSDTVLRFSHTITDSVNDLQSKISVTTGGTPVSFTVEKVDGGQSLKLMFDEPLAAATNFDVTFNEPLNAEGGRNVDVPNASGDPGVQFQTRGSLSGIASLTNTSETFEIASQVPSASGDFKAMNFSTFRVTMTQPIHPDWESLGGSVQLLDQDDQPVPATVLVKGNRIALDPCVTAEPTMCGSKDDILNSGAEYTLQIQNLPSLTDPSGSRFSSDWTFTPRDTGPTVTLKQTAIDSGLASGASESESMKSILNGQVINGVTLNSVLQGNAGPSQQTGDLFAELAFAPAFKADEALPLRIPKGSVLRSTSLDVLVGGEVPVLDAATGNLQTTGDIKVTMMSDASGYMSPNPYTDDLSAPRHITLFMDVSMNTDNAQPNAALSQTLMGVELRGIAIVENGVLTIDAIGTVEPGLLGQEYTDSTIAFHLEAATDVDSALDAENEREMDATAPSLLSWMPGPVDAIPATRQSMQRPGDPVILFFDEPLAPDSLDGNITLTENGTTVSNLDMKLDGTTITLNPEGGLKHGVDYQVLVNGVTDLAGNPTALAPLEFALDPIDGSSIVKRPPLALTTYPGYPCETNHSVLDLENGVLGQCYDVRGDAYTGGRDATVDTMPVSTMPADRPITVVFSKSIDPDSVIEGTTFIVEKVTQNGVGSGAITSSEPVSGRLELGPQRLRFFPDEAWQPGDHYRYTLASSEAAGACSAGTYSAICDTDGLALKTDLLEGLNDSDPGADPLTIYFTGTEAVDTVFTPLRNLPIRDTNSNFLVDCNAGTNDSGNRTFENVENCLEPFEHGGSDAEGWASSANSTKLAVTGKQASASGLVSPTAPAQVGCVAGEGVTCPRAKFIYQSYALNTEVKGPGIYDPDPNVDGDEIEGILVDLYPTMLSTTSISVFTKIYVLGFIPLQEETVTNTQVLRMRYAKDDPACTGSNCARNSLVPGVIAEGENGQPVFITKADLLIDAPDMAIPLGGTHDLYGRPFTLDLKGDITFFDDGRMQIEQRNSNRVGASDELLVTANTGGFQNAGVVTLRLPLEIPVNGTYLNFISNPVKDLPAQQ
ncbi:Ig-like domain-containing protein [Marinobacter sp. CHS3-4]|uniref:Ig-like domain-containing protein n=1 Tax=Marinobacter sp. CHS3-4 TaxID=3045174 RepID=UPI0024B52D80|nr:Ig-like domain-containing protein [Marinobacter sp. CHS3-4]MDI9246561.1 Ig-like domain-containing protein [Marinobacter sp. CHS3-4]